MTQTTPICPDDVVAAMGLADFDAAAAQRLMSPDSKDRLSEAEQHPDARRAAALLYVFPRDGALHFPLTLRREDLPEHRGQVSLPGGRPNAGELSWETAVREAHEEIGLAQGLPRAVGLLAPVYIRPTDTILDVHVALGPDPITFVAEVREVAALRLVTLDTLLDPAVRRVERMRRSGREMTVPSFDLVGFDVWGATAIALSELCERLRSVRRRVDPGAVG